MNSAIATIHNMLEALQKKAKIAPCDASERAGSFRSGVDSSPNKTQPPLTTRRTDYIFEHRDDSNVTPNKDIDESYPFGPIDLTGVAAVSSLSSSPSCTDDNNEEEEDYDIAPKQDGHQYYFGLLGKTQMHYNFPPAKRVKWVHTPDDDDDDQEENLYYYDIAPKQDAQQYYFGLAATAGQSTKSWDFSTVATTSNNNDNAALTVVPPSDDNDDDDENVYYYDVAPKQDANQYYFGLAPGQSHHHHHHHHFNFDDVSSKDEKKQPFGLEHIGATHWSQ